MDELQKYKCNLAVAIKQLEYWINCLEKEIASDEERLTRLKGEEWEDRHMRRQEKRELKRQYEGLIRIITVR